MTILFTIILIVVFTAFCGALAFVAPGLSKTMLTEKAKIESQIPDADRSQKIKGYSLYALAGGCFIAILIWAGIYGYGLPLSSWHWNCMTICFLTGMCLQRQAFSASGSERLQVENWRKRIRSHSGMAKRK